MNLYSIDFEHWSQKDSQTGIKGYLIAENDEQVLDWFLANDEFNGQQVWTWWKDAVEEKPKRRERLLRKKGELYDQKRLDGLSDLYYGARLFGWRLTCEVDEAEAAVLLKTGVAKLAKP